MNDFLTGPGYAGSPNDSLIVLDVTPFFTAVVCEVPSWVLLFFEMRKEELLLDLETEFLCLLGAILIDGERDRLLTFEDFLLFLSFLALLELRFLSLDLPLLLDDFESLSLCLCSFFLLGDLEFSWREEDLIEYPSR